MMSTMKVAALVTPTVSRVRKYTPSPRRAVGRMHRICRRVRLKAILFFTRERSRGTDTNAMTVGPPPVFTRGGGRREAGPPPFRLDPPYRAPKRLRAKVPVRMRL